MMFRRADVTAARRDMWNQFNYGDRDGTQDWTLDQRVMYEFACLLADRLSRFETYDWPTPAHGTEGQPPTILWSWIRDQAHRRAKREVSA